MQESVDWNGRYRFTAPKNNEHEAIDGSLTLTAPSSSRVGWIGWAPSETAPVVFVRTQDHRAWIIAATTNGLGELEVTLDGRDLRGLWRLEGRVVDVKGERETPP